MDRSGRMPQNYEWRCKVCEAPNLAGHLACARCRHDAHMRPSDVDAARRKLSLPPDPDDAVSDLKRLFSDFTRTQLIVGALATTAVILGIFLLRHAPGTKIIGLCMVIAGLAAFVSFPPDPDRK